MIANDIVDFKYAKHTSQWEHPRFLDKLFSSAEQTYIHTAKDAFTALWHLWSMKEAAYKLYVQLYPSRFYNPKAFVCTCKGAFQSVHYKNFICNVTTFKTTQFVLSEAHLKTVSELKSIPIKLPATTAKTQSETLRHSLLQDIAEHYNVSVSKIHIKKTAFGVPKAYINSKATALHVALTHHGHFGAYTFLET